MYITYPEPFLISFLWRSFCIFIIYAMTLSSFCEAPRTLLLGSIQDYNYTLYHQQHALTSFLPFSICLGLLHVRPLHFLTILKLYLYLFISHLCGCAHAIACVWGSEAHTGDSLLFFQHVGIRVSAQAVGLGGDSPASHQNWCESILLPCNSAVSVCAPPFVTLSNWLLLIIKL